MPRAGRRRVTVGGPIASALQPHRNATSTTIVHGHATHCVPPRAPPGGAVSYRYRFRDTERLTAWVGFTAKIRDAEIALEQGPISSSSDDLGFVPLLHLSADWQAAPRWQLSVDADALAGRPGRAVDATLKAGYDLDESWRLSAGYRTVEGGADVSSVYNFAWLHYAVLSLTWRR